jgi:hypothetical protein
MLFVFRSEDMLRSAVASLNLARGAGAQCFSSHYD